MGFNGTLFLLNDDFSIDVFDYWKVVAEPIGMRCKFPRKSDTAGKSLSWSWICSISMFDYQRAYRIYLYDYI